MRLRFRRARRESSDLAILDRYVTSAPSPQNALNIFKGEWTSKLPAEWSALEAGHIPLFEDDRVRWAIEAIGGVAGKTALELGPLEAGHSFMLEQSGAVAVVAVEANTRAFLKCLVIKELLGLTRTRFLCGDFVEYLRAEPGRFDLCLASGVLYHMVAPVELLARLSTVTPRLYLWTHYYDEALVRANAPVAVRLTTSAAATYAEFAHTLYRYEYQSSLGFSGFCGGSAPFSHWMTRDDILRCLRHFGWTTIETGFEQPDHPHGPCFAVVAKRDR